MDTPSVQLTVTGRVCRLCVREVKLILLPSNSKNPTLLFHSSGFWYSV